MANMTNADFWNLIRATYPTFKSITAEATADMFSERGFEMLKTTNPAALNDFFNLSIRVSLDIINISHAKNDFEDAGFGRTFDNPMGGIIQRMAINSVTPISPAYRNLANGAGPDPFVVRKPTVKERMWKQNFDYQSLITIQDEFQMKTIFISQYGMSEFMAGILAGLENGWTKQKYVNVLEALNAGINSTDTPLKSTQKVDTAITNIATATADNLRSFILAVKNTISAMGMGPSSNGFNAMGFDSIQDKDRLRLLVRPGLKNAIATNLTYSAFNPTDLNLDVPVIEVPHFGGLKPYVMTGTGNTTKTYVYPVYDALGAVSGFAASATATTADYDVDEVQYEDPNASVLGLLADKDVVFHAIQNGYSVEPIRNPRGLYLNYWASSPGNTYGYDPLYNLVEFLYAAA